MGCYADGSPHEDCSQHGRSPSDLWGIIREISLERDRANRVIDRLLAQASEIDSVNGYTISLLYFDTYPTDDVFDEISEFAHRVSPSVRVVGGPYGDALGTRWVRQIIEEETS
jgi:hypothetical protein